MNLNISINVRLIESLWIFILTSLTIGLEAKLEKGGSSKSVRNMLIEELLVGYQPLSLPLTNVTHKLVVHVRSQLYQIIEMDMASNTIKLSAGLSMFWKDSYLIWDPDLYDGIKSIHIPAKKVWTPDLTIFYSVTKTMSRITTDDHEVVVQHDGTVEAAVAFSANSLCPFNIRKFPFDSQECSIVFGSFSHTTATMDIEPYGTVGMRNFYDHQEWVLDNRSLVKDYIRYYDRHGSKQITGVAKLVVRINRQPFYYIFVLVIPALIITLVAIVGFHVPSSTNLTRSSKVQLGQVTLLSMSVLLVGVSKQLPKFAITVNEGKRGSFSSVPLLGIFYLSLLFLILMNVLTNSILISLERFVVTHRRYPTWMTSCSDIMAKLRPTSGKDIRTSPRDSNQLSNLEDVNQELIGLQKGSRPSFAPDRIITPDSSSSLRATANATACNNVQHPDQSRKQDEDRRLQLAILEKLDKTANSIDALVASIKTSDVGGFGKINKSKSIHRLTERIERVLFGIYLFILFMIGILFFNHGWY